MVRPRDVFPYVLVCASVLCYFLLRITDSFSWPEAPLSALAAAGSVAEVAVVAQEVHQEIPPGAIILDPESSSSTDIDEVNADQCPVSESFPQDVRRWCELINEYAGRHGLEPDLVAALIWQESGGNPQAYSRSGAVGLMQVMPRDGLAASFVCANGPCFENRPTIAKLEDPEFNISYGARMLANLVKRYGNLRDALKAYGPMDVGYSYADTVLRLVKRYGQ